MDGSRASTPASGHSLATPELHDDAPGAAALRASLARFSYTPSPSPRQRSPTKPSPLPSLTSPQAGPSQPKRKRRSLGLDGEVETTSRSPKKPKRGYADPDTYSHLHFLQDHLKEELDVMFCGINPGYKSAEDGHHFAHGTNHFWPCLYRSGLTSRLLSPTEDYTLPESFSLGLTNLVDRPSAEQAELSKAEESAAAPALLRRISRFRPRIVCFVGMGIWTSVEGVIRKTAPRAPRQASASSPAPGKEKTRLGLQPYKMVHTTNDATMSVRETLFFVVPSTSGRVQRYQLPQKVEFFASLKASLEDAKSATLDTSYMTVVAEALLTKE